MQMLRPLLPQHPSTGVNLRVVVGVHGDASRVDTGGTRPVERVECCLGVSDNSGTQALFEVARLAEYVLAPAHQLVHAPAGIPDEQLGAAPLAALTAYQALFEVAKLSASERVLIHAGAGGVGHLAIQLALNAGATVYATASEKNRDFIQSLGAEFIDYTTQDFRQVLGSTLDVVLNSTGAQTFIDSLDVLVPGGRIVTLTSPDPLETARERGFTAEWLTVHPDRYQLGEIARLMSLGIVKVHVDQTFPLEQAAKAHELVGSRHVRGKVVLVP